MAEATEAIPKGSSGRDVPAFKPRWFQLYVGLAVINLATVGASLALGVRLMSIYTQSVHANEEWAARRNLYVDLTAIAGAVNAPPNDVFESHDVRGERARMAHALGQFDSAAAVARAGTMTNVDTADARVLLQGLDSVQAVMSTMVGDGSRVLDFAEAGQPDSAGHQMAVMDRRYGELNAALRELQGRVIAVQNANFERDLATAVQLRNYERVVAAGVLLMICGMVGYGVIQSRNAAQAMRISEEQLEAIRENEACVRALNDRLEERVAARTAELSASLGALQRSEERFHLVSSATNDLVWDWDLVSQRMWRSDAMNRLFGYEQSDGSTEWWRAHVHPDDRAHMVEEIDAALDGSAPSYAAEYRFRRADGEYSDVLDRGTVVRDAAGVPVRVVGSVQDISDRRRIKRELAEQNVFLRQVIDTIPSMVFVKDRAGTFILVNQSIADAYGVSAEAMIGRNDRDFNPDHEQIEAFRRDDLRVMDTREPLVIPEEGITDASGRQRWLQTVKVPILDADGTSNRILGVATDISIRKEAERILHDARVVAEAANTAKSEFVANMSHEIRTPMNGVLGMLDLTLDTDLAPDQREFLTTAKSSGEALLDIINDILDFSKIEAGQLDLDPHPFDLGETLAGMVGPLALRAHQKGLELAVEIAAEVPDRLVGDAGRIRQVIVNLVGNAIKFTARGEITLRVDVDERSADDVVLHVSVRDTGVGIPADKQRVIFQAFQQADSSTTRQYGGTGLGLAISSRLVALLGGTISVESVPGEGSTFHFTARLGIAADSAPVPELRGELEGVEVLVVDDNATNRRILERTLTRWGMSPTLVAGAAEALSELERPSRTGRPFGLIITDVDMPGMDGFALVEHLRRTAHSAGSTIMMLSSTNQREAVARCRQLGIRHYLLKPVQQETLLRAVESALGGTKPGEEAAPGAAAPATPSRPLRILVAEDNPVNQRLVESILVRRGHQVVVVADGARAVEELARHHFDVALMDVQMPVMGGFDATRALRRHEAEEGKGAHLPIIALTARAMTGDREACLAAGMDGYVSKPVRQADLFAAIDQLVSSGGTAPDEPRPAAPRDGGDDVLTEGVLREVTGGDAELTRQLLSLFWESCPSQVEGIRAGVDAGDAESVELAAHALKGASAAIGARRVAALAAEIERASRLGRTDLAPVLERLERELDLLRIRCDTVILPVAG